MARTLLQEMVEGRPYGSLPANWSSFDLKRFSRQKQLWGYQRDAVASAVVALWKYYEEFGDYQRGECLDVNLERKRRFYQWYQDNELPAGMNLQVGRLGRKLRALLEEYYDLNSPLETPHPNPLPASGAGGNVVQGRGRTGGGTAGEIPFESIVNRMCFWMATGSGKTLVLVKLIEVLRGLILAGEIPPNDILVLTHREDLIEQLKRHVQEFNSSRNDLYIRLRELKEYAEAKRENPSLFGAREMKSASDAQVKGQKAKTKSQNPSRISCQMYSITTATPPGQTNCIVVSGSEALPSCCRRLVRDGRAQSGKSR